MMVTIFLPKNVSQIAEQQDLVWQMRNIITEIDKIQNEKMDQHRKTVVFYLQSCQFLSHFQIWEQKFIKTFLFQYSDFISLYILIIMHLKEIQKSFHFYSKFSTRKQSLQSTDDEKSIEKVNRCPCDSSKIKYKTQLCKNFSENGFCRYGKKCRFAHGPNELKRTEGIKGEYYRTKKCHSFWVLGQCSYGSRCQFSHYQTVDNKEILMICKKALCQENQDASCSRLFTLLG